jgi:hypothetical protein
MKHKRILAVLIALGVLLRVACARGDLWVDEIWTLELVAPLRDGFAVFRDISHDNNHFLNSLWMYLLGQDAPPLLYRLPSILFGGLSILVAGRIGARQSPAAGLVAAFLVAFAFPFVNYGSEARGYGALILAMLVAYDALDRALPLLGRPESRTELTRLGWIMGAAAGFGAFSHLEMFLGMATLALAGLAGAVAFGANTGRAARLGAAARLFVPSALLMLPAVAAVAAGMARHGVTIGALTHFDGGFATGYGGLVAALAGLPAATPGWLALALALGLLVLAAVAGWLTRAQALFAFVSLVAVPALIFLADPPNQQYPRYYLVFGALLAPLAAAAAAGLWTRPWGRPAVVAGAALFLLGQAGPLSALARHGRGEVSPLVALMAQAKTPSYASQIKRSPQYVVDYYARRAGIVLTRTPMPFDCGQVPDFYLVGVPLDFAIAEEKTALGTERCRTDYVAVADAPGSALSGMHWRLFHRADKGADAPVKAAN